DARALGAGLLAGLLQQLARVLEELLRLADLGRAGLALDVLAALEELLRLVVVFLRRLGVDVRVDDDRLGRLGVGQRVEISTRAEEEQDRERRGVEEILLRLVVSAATGRALVAAG